MSKTNTIPALTEYTEVKTIKLITGSYKDIPGRYKLPDLSYFESRESDHPRNIQC